MQIVYISNRSGISRETLTYVENLMPFISEVVFVCPGSQVKEFHFNSRVPVTVIDEAMVLGGRLKRFQDSTDHQFKNCLLRLSLATAPDIHDEFIMSDDDNRPLVEIPLSFYKSSNRYHAYYYYDLKQWPVRETDYDMGQRQTYKILEDKGYPTLSYSSHMPQIMSKSLLGEVAFVFQDSLDKGLPLDEWSAYFNYGQTVCPERFHPPEPFSTLCWPAFPSDWDLHVRPDQFFFENFYSVLYENDLVFSNLPTHFVESCHPEISSEKIRRRTALQNGYESGEMFLWGRIFFFFRDMASHFPLLKKRLNELISPSCKAAILHFFSSGFTRHKKKRIFRQND